ncbi:MAG: hypothetical protein K6U89_19055, partial [Chloroflexi bacterium]|nr:hypothetical protein [Chloroflexota bacterium]
MIDIKETETELLLFIPASQKERAKSIDGRRWDPERRCWVYPKTARMYDALLAEFGDDLVSLTVARPSGAAPAVVGLGQASARLAVENRELRDELAQIRATLEQLGTQQEGRAGGDIELLQTTLAARDSEVLELRRQLEEKEQQLQQVERDAALAQAEVARLQAINVALEADAARAASDADERRRFVQTLKELAKYTAGNCPPFAKLVDELKLNNDSAPVVLGKELERELRRRLNVGDYALNLYDLIAQARDSDLLTPEGVDLAHT